MRDGSVRVIENAVRELLARRSRLVVAVSGGVDSAVLLDAIARLRTEHHRIVVASVDHGSGEAATEATAMVLATAARHGLAAISERLDVGRADEASWRAGRWAFLERVAAAEEAHVVTGHTRNDHIETVVMRILRGASARGLAGLLAPSKVERPLLAHDRATIDDYANRRDVPFTNDPTNESLAFLRNRIRLDLLPAIRRVTPRFEERILSLSKRAAALRIEVDSVAEGFILGGGPSEGALIVLDANALDDLGDESLRLLLPSIAARAGITLDRRGLMRLADVVRAAPGSRGQISGGYEAVRRRSDLTIVKRRQALEAVMRLRPAGETRFGVFRFSAEPAATIQVGESGKDAWRMFLPKSVEPVVRQWHAGDRLKTDRSGGRRRVKRFFADAGIVGPLRIGWPVVLCGDDLVWIPGVKASQDAVGREGRMVHYTCERLRE